MLAYTVHEPPEPATDRLDRAESLVFVKDGFNWFAALLPPIWMILNRLWWPLAIYLVVISLLTMVFEQFGVPQGWQALAMISLSGVIGFEADSIRRWNLDRKGWQFVGTVVGRNAVECERRFFETWLPRQPVLRLPGHEELAPNRPGETADQAGEDTLMARVDLHGSDDTGRPVSEKAHRSGLTSRLAGLFGRRPAKQS